MHVFLTGGTGFVGSAVLRRLLDEGHRVTALVRSEASAARVAAAGAAALPGDITDAAWLARRMAEADAAIHTAATGDATSAQVDASIAAAAREAFAGTEKSYVHTSGVWMYGSGDAVTERTPFAPVAPLAWRQPIERDVLAVPARTAIVVPGVVYGYGVGIPLVIAGAPRTASGALTLPGDGTQRWITVHVDDLADLYSRLLERGEGGSYWIASDGANPNVRTLGEAASRAAGTDGAVAPESAEETRRRLGAFAEGLLRSQSATGAKARSELGWNPTRPSLAEELEHGSYAPGR
ncbi:NAD-dependent epimerase/dehydratase family protein [Streptomyces fagopyri]|uniref:NAD-dependent epimerase/dehydratase family protein n=1 Tax=Streptomyces fagopyri TaxID=2662397 RepID=A0A5Q0L5Q8_9ACTN|nr:NAD-dependent epimerase/dehydratase family protein [Streptomyces fagopyri]QFZ72313.1 NAD-dependent epimerase/dehydratase family protein [Streptomyces fagopyri]